MTEADVNRQAELDADEGRRRGYVPESQVWGEDNGVRTLTITYRYAPGANPPAAPVGPVATPTSDPGRTWSFVAAVGGVVIAIAAVLPWVQATAPFVGTISRNGIDGGGDGLIAVVVGVLIALVGIGGAMRGRGRPRLLLLLAGIAAVVFALFEYSSVSAKIDSLNNATTVVSIGIGLWAVGIGGVITFLAAAQIRD